MSRDTHDGGVAAVEIADERSLLAASGPAGLLASERLVRQHQAEILRAAYLLSGEPREARSQGQLAFLRFFERTLHGNEIADQRERIVEELAAVYLESRRNGYRPPSPPRPAPADAEPTRFTVDDQRSRVMDALDRLEPPVRAALVLRAFNALQEETVCKLLDLSLYDLRVGLEPARARLRDAAGAAQDAPVQPLLAQAAIGEPVSDIWLELEEPVQRLHTRQATQRRRLVAGVGLGTALLLALGTVWLFGLNPFSPNETEGQALVPLATSTLAAPPNVLRQLPSPTPTPEPTMPDNPLGNVPDQLVMVLDVLESQSTGRQTRSALYDPVTGDLQVINAPDGDINLSLDGKWLVYRNYLQSAAEVRWHQNAVTVIDAQTGARVWFRVFPAFSSWTMVGEHIYATHWGETIQLVEIDIATGELLTERTNLIDDMELDSEVHVAQNLRLLASPDRSRLLVSFNRRAHDGGAYGQVLATYALPGLDHLATTSWEYDLRPAVHGTDAFAYYLAEFTPDGAALYAPSGDSVQFLTIGESEPAIVEIPFHPFGEYEVFDTRTVSSNDGRYLYVLALARMEVAVVDLLTRSVDLVVPFDHGRFSLLPDVDESGSHGTVSYFGAVLSPDGRRMYLLGGWEDTRQPLEEDQTAIWVIDVATWKVTDRIAIPGWPGQLMWTHGGERMIIHVRPKDETNTASDDNGYVFIEAATGRILPGLELADFPDRVDGIYAMYSIEQLYRRTYDRRPVVEGVVPETVKTASTLPRLEVISSRALVPSGGAVELDLRILDPATGQPLDRNNPGVRFDPSVNPMLVLHQPDSGAETILVPSRSGPGRYSGIAPVEQEGPWDVEVRFGTGEGNVARVNVTDVFNVTPSFESGGGALYTLRVQAEAGTPAESAEWTIRASFVNIETGQVLPEGQSLESGLPSDLNVTFEHEDYTISTAALTQTRHGVYEGKTRFRGPGSWSSRVTFRSGSSNAKITSIETGTVVVGRADP